MCHENEKKNNSKLPHGRKVPEAGHKKQSLKRENEDAI